VAQELWRVLRDDGTFWLNLGDAMASTGGNHCGRDDNQPGVEGKTCHEAGGGDNGHRRPAPGLKPTDLCGIPWRVALALQADGWFLRSDVIWAKPNPQPESVTSRPAKSHEYIFMLTKRGGSGAYFDMEAVKEPSTRYDTRKPYSPGQVDKRGDGHDRGAGKVQDRDGSRRNLRDVWTITTRGFPGSHFATYPVDIPDRCIRASTSEVGVCGACGSPWRRWTGRACAACDEDIPTQGKSCPSCGHVNDWKQARQEHPQFGETGWSTPGRGAPRKDGSMGSSKTHTGDFRPTCTCGHEDVTPAVVLDPFLGSGTTAIAAQALGRRWVGCEISEQYACMAVNRIRAGGDEKTRREFEGAETVGQTTLDWGDAGG
jgi:DNA modification methylase